MVNVACLAIMTDVITEVEPRVQTDPNMPRTSRDVRSEQVVGMLMGGVLIVTLTMIVCVKHALELDLNPIDIDETHLKGDEL